MDKKYKLKFQAIGEDSFYIESVPCILGSENINELRNLK
jgi:hypothetical protein